MEYYVYGFMDTEIHTYLLVRDAWFTFYADHVITSKCHLLVLLKCLGTKQCGPRPDCSSWGRLIWIHTVCLYVEISNWHNHTHHGSR